MMPLQSTRNHHDPELDDLLGGLCDQVLRLDELHSHDDNDAEYVWVIWLKGARDLDIDETEAFIQKLLLNNPKLSSLDFHVPCAGMVILTEDVTA